MVMVASSLSLRAADLAIRYEKLAPGVDYGTYETETPPTFVHVVRVDLAAPGVSVGAIQARGRQAVTAMAKAMQTPERDIVAVINGDYFDESAGRGPWGPHVQNGELVYTALRRKSAFMITPDGKPLIDVPKVNVTATFTEGRVALVILDVNRHDKLEKAGYHLLTPRAEVRQVDVEDGAVLVLKGKPPQVGKAMKATVLSVDRDGGQVAIPPDGMLLICAEAHTFKSQQMKPGVELVLKAEVTPACRELIGGGPAMIKNGGTRIEFLKEEFSPAHLAYLNTSRHPRSAIGHSRDKRFVYLVVVEGRLERSHGMEVKELAQSMMALGCHEAMEFDGGGSSTLFTVREKSSTADTAFRNVANGLGVFRMMDTPREPTEQPDLPDQPEPDEPPAPKPAPKPAGDKSIDDILDEVLGE